MLLGANARDPRRVVLLDGATNFRDIGGYVTSGGRTVRFGQVFRSENLAGLTDSDHAVLARLGISAICDFRRDEEVAERPSRLPSPSPTVVRLAMSDTIDADKNTIDSVHAVFQGRAPVPPIDFWNEHYEDILERGRPMFVRWFETMASTDGAVLFHCAGGKDRTGLGSMLLLSWLGVGDDDVADDFELTNALRTPWRVQGLRQQLLDDAGITSEDAAHVIGVWRGSILHALGYVRDKHDGVESYLVGGGLSAQALTRVRKRLID